MNDIGAFLAHAVKLEEEAALRFADLSEAMKTYGNTEVAAFFTKMAEYSRKHLAEARARTGFRAIPDLDPVWPDGDSPEATSMEASHYLMTVDYALSLALEGERRSQAFYADIARDTTDPEVRMAAEEFAQEEAEHVSALEALARKYPKVA